MPDAFIRDQPLRLLYLGSLSPEKVADIIVSALASLPVGLPVTLDIYGLQQDGGPFMHEVIRAVERNDRINLREPVPPEEVTALLRAYHILLVPSQC